MDTPDDSSIKLKEEVPDHVIVDQDGNYKVFRRDNSVIGTVSNSTEGKNILAALDPDYKTKYGFDISINGKVYAGDRFDIQINSNGIGDNRNGLAMCAMQSEDLVADSSRNGIKQNFTERYSMLTSGFGTVVSNAQANATASEAKLAQSTDLYESTTGVSLDEEAANLVKFQQYYQAAARIISASQTVFDALISAV